MQLFISYRVDSEKKNLTTTLETILPGRAVKTQLVMRRMSVINESEAQKNINVTRQTTVDREVVT